MIEAYEAARREEFRNIASAPEYGVSRRTLHSRVKKGVQPFPARQPVSKVLEWYQKEALVRWVAKMRDWNMTAP